LTIRRANGGLAPGLISVLGPEAGEFHFPRRRDLLAVELGSGKEPQEWVGLGIGPCLELFHRLLEAGCADLGAEVMRRVEQHETAMGPVEDGDFAFTVEDVIDHVAGEDRDAAALGPLLIVDVDLVLDAELRAAGGGGQSNYPTGRRQHEGHREKADAELVGHGISLAQRNVESAFGGGA
jgi:hypothetical protein